MTITVFTPDRLFAELSQDRFEDYDAFEQAFIERFNAHRFDLPIGFGWRDALEWGVRHGLVERDGKQIAIHAE